MAASILFSACKFFNGHPQKNLRNNLGEHEIASLLAQGAPQALGQR